MSASVARALLSEFLVAGILYSAFLWGVGASPTGSPRSGSLQIFKVRVYGNNPCGYLKGELS
jgi:hypothetical protein